MGRVISSPNFEKRSIRTSDFGGSDLPVPHAKNQKATETAFELLVPSASNLTIKVISRAPSPLRPATDTRYRPSPSSAIRIVSCESAVNERHTSAACSLTGFASCARLFSLQYFPLYPHFPASLPFWASNVIITLSQKLTQGRRMRHGAYHPPALADHHPP